MYKRRSNGRFSDRVYRESEKQIKPRVASKRGKATGIDGRQAGISILRWEAGTLYRRSNRR